MDFGFLNPETAEGLTTTLLKRDEMLAVLPRGHAVAEKSSVTPDELAREPYILLDEGEFSEPLEFFHENYLAPNTQYIVYDDYTIMSMVEQGLGVSVLSALVLNRHGRDIEIRRIEPGLVRSISVAYKKQGRPSHRRQIFL